MHLQADLWFLFPLAIGICTLATASGIGGAIFYTPLFIIGLGLDPQTAVSAALITQLFGFSSGLTAYLRTGLIDFRLARQLLPFSIPAALLGAWYSDLIPAPFLKLLFGAGIIFIGSHILHSWLEERNTPPTEDKQEGTVVLTDRSGRTHSYTPCGPGRSRFFALLGGGLVGMISVGLAELQEYHMITRCKMPAPVVVATTVFVVMITVLVASAGRYLELILHGGDTLLQVQHIVLFTIPGVLIGGQIGPRLQNKLPADTLKAGLSVLFILTGIFMVFVR